MKKDRRSNCPISYALDLIGDKWSLLILRDILFFDKKHYHEFIDSSEGISTNILADRLHKLECAGLISKNQNEENLKKFIYSPTAKSLDLIPMLMEMVLWGAKHDSKTGAPANAVKAMKADRAAFIKSVRKKFQ
jgi:DNA-binding HxlR family transcriptional regulator